MENRNFKGWTTLTFFSFKAGSKWKWKIIISKGGVLGNLDESSLLGIARSQGVAKALPRRCQVVAKRLCQGVAKALLRRC